MGKLTLKKLRKQTATLRAKVKTEKSRADREAEKKRLRKELFKLKHRRGIRAGKFALGGLKAGLSGALAIRTAIRKGALTSPTKKLKKRKKKRRKSKRRRVKKIIVFR